MKKIGIAFFLLLSLSLTACKNQAYEKVQSAVREKLNDPESAQFRLITPSKVDPSGDTFCGEVNAKNAMGGYVGYRAFVVMDGKVLAMAGRSMSFEDVEAALKTKPLSGDATDPLFIWGFCLEASK